MLIVCLLLWTIGFVVIRKDNKTESAWWFMLAAFFSGLGALSMFIHESIILHFISNNGLSKKNIDLLYNITAIMTTTVHNIDPYCMLLYGISSANIISKEKKIKVYILLFVPSILSYILLPIKSNALRTPEELITYFRYLSIWTIPYMIGGSYFLIYSYIKEKSYTLKKYKLLNAILVVPYFIYAVIANFILRDLGIDNSWRYFVVLIPILFVGFIFFAFKYGILGVRLKFERHKFAFEDIFNHISDSFIALNQNLSIIEVNRMFFENFNRERKKYNNFDEITDEESKLCEHRDVLLDIIKKSKDGDVSTIEILVNYEDESKYFEVQANPILANGEYFGAIMVFKDITAHKKVIKLIEENQSQIIENARLESLGNLIGSIAHNLKTPLTSSSGGIDLIDKYLNDIEIMMKNQDIKQKEDFDSAIKKIKKWESYIKKYLIYMNDTINTVKGQVHINVSDDESFSIKEMVNRVDILMKDEVKKHNCIIKYCIMTSEEYRISGSINYMLQVLNILISNAKDSYDDKKGIIELIIEEFNNKIFIKVKDNGKGIPEAIKDKIFYHMITTKGKDGSGLGLYISKSIIKTKFKGEISFESDKGGSQFSVMIPKGDI